MDWARCPEVESRPGVVSGPWVVRGTRTQADAVVENADDGLTAEKIATDLFDGLSMNSIRRILECAGTRHVHLA